MKKLHLFILALLAILIIASCATDADVASNNLSKQAEQFGD